MKLRPRKAAIQRRVGLRKQEVGMEGVLPMVESTAAVSKVKLSATETIAPCCGSSVNQRTVKQARKAKMKPMRPGRSRKPLRVFAVGEAVSCWSVDVM